MLHESADGVMRHCRAASPETCPVSKKNPDAIHAATAKEGYRLIEEREKAAASTDGVDKFSKSSKSSADPDVIYAGIPVLDRDFESRDAFFNHTGESDPEAIDAIADYYYWRAVSRTSDEQRLVAQMKMMAAKDHVHATKLGSKWHGWETDPEHLTRADDSTMPETFEVDREQAKAHHQLLEADETRPSFENKAMIGDYLMKSKEFIKQLTPAEHNVMAYWTGNGSNAAAVAAYGSLVKNSPFHYQTEDPKEPSYLDSKKLLSTLDSALAKAELEEPVVLFRGLSADTIQDGEVLSESYRSEDGNEDGFVHTSKWLERNGYVVGQRMKFGAPMATSSNPQASLRFSGGVILEIQAHRAGAVGAIGAWGAGEQEYVAPCDVEYEVVTVQHKVTYAFENSRSPKGRRQVATVVQLRQI